MGYGGGQHRYLPVRYVERRHAAVRLFVKRAALRNERARVRDVDAEPVFLRAVVFTLQPLKRQCVVSVPRVGVVDGDGEQIGQVDAVGVGKQSIVTHCFCGGERVIVESFRDFLAREFDGFVRLEHAAGHQRIERKALEVACLALHLVQQRLDQRAARVVVAERGVVADAVN